MNYILIVFIVVVIVAFSLWILSLTRKHKRSAVLYEENYDLKAITIADIDRMEDGSGFEMYLYRLLIELGYSGVYKTLGSRDFGADVVFTDREGVRNVIQVKRYSIEYPVGINFVKLIDRTDLIHVIEAFRDGDMIEARDIIEEEPRMILESWSEANSNTLHEVRKDYKAEKYVKKVMSK